MITNHLNVDRMEPFPVDNFALVSTWPLNTYMCPIDAANDSGKASLSKKPCFISCLSAAVDGHRTHWFCFRARAVETLLTILETVHFGMPPTVSPTTSKKLPLAKKRRATRTCSWGFKVWVLLVGLSRSGAGVSVIY